MELVETVMTSEELITEIEVVHDAIHAALNEVGRLADLCSGADGDETSAGVHGMQMAYDKLYEASMWTSQALGEMQVAVVVKVAIS